MRGPGHESPRGARPSAPPNQPWVQPPRAAAAEEESAGAADNAAPSGAVVSSALAELDKAMSAHTLSTGRLLETLSPGGSFTARFVLARRRVLLGVDPHALPVEAVAATIGHLEEQGERWFLLVCPTERLGLWAAELRRWLPSPMWVLTGPDVRRHVASWRKVGGVGLTGPGQAADVTPPERLSLVVVDAPHQAFADPTASAVTRNFLQAAATTALLEDWHIEQDPETLRDLVTVLQPALVQWSGDTSTIRDPADLPRRLSPAYLRLEQPAARRFEPPEAEGESQPTTRPRVPAVTAASGATGPLAALSLADVVAAAAGHGERRALLEQSGTTLDQLLHLVEALDARPGHAAPAREAASWLGITEVAPSRPHGASRASAPSPRARGSGLRPSVAPRDSRPGGRAGNPRDEQRVGRVAAVSGQPRPAWSLPDVGRGCINPS